MTHESSYFHVFYFNKNQFMNTKYLIVLLAVSSVLLASCSDGMTDTTVNTNDDTVVVESEGSLDSMDDVDSMQEEGVMIGGAMMLPSLDIIDNAVNSSDHTTLVTAVDAAGLVEALK